MIEFPLPGMMFNTGQTVVASVYNDDMQEPALVLVLRIDPRLHGNYYEVVVMELCDGWPVRYSEGFAENIVPATQLYVDCGGDF